MNEIELCIRMDEDILSVLLANSDSIEDIVKRSATKAAIKTDYFPIISEDGARTKSVNDVIIVSLVMAPLIIRELTRALQVYFDATSEQVIDNYWELEEIRQPNGEVLIDETGRPYMKRVRIYRHLKPEYIKIPDNEVKLAGVIEFILEKFGK